MYFLCVGYFQFEVLGVLINYFKKIYLIDIKSIVQELGILFLGTQF
jgi:hypothetical protein